MWILPGSDEQVHLGWQVLDQEGKDTVNRFCINSVVVVEDKDEIVRDSGDFIDQSRQNRFDGWRLGGLERPQHSSPDVLRNRLQGSDEVGKKARGVAIPFVQRQPGDRPPATGDPLADQRGLAETGWSGDEGQPAVQALVEARDQAWSEDGMGPGWGCEELGR